MFAGKGCVKSLEHKDARRLQETLVFLEKTPMSDILLHFEGMFTGIDEHDRRPDYPKLLTRRE